MTRIAAILREEGLVRSAGRRQTDNPNEELLVRALLEIGYGLQARFGASMVRESYKDYSPAVKVWFRKNPSRFPGKLGVHLITDWGFHQDARPFSVSLDMTVNPGGGIYDLGAMKVQSVEDLIARKDEIRAWASLLISRYENRTGPLA